MTLRMFLPISKGKALPSLGGLWAGRTKSGFKGTNWGLHAASVFNLAPNPLDFGREQGGKPIWGSHSGAERKVWNGKMERGTEGVVLFLCWPTLHGSLESQ